MLELFGLPTLTLDKDQQWSAESIGLAGLIFPGPEIIDVASPEAYPVIKIKLQRASWPIKDGVYLIEDRLRGSWLTRDIDAAFLVTRVTQSPMFSFQWQVLAESNPHKGVPDESWLGWYRLIVSRGFLKDIRKQSRQMLENV